MDTTLKLSIITVNLNNAGGLRTTIDSVITQTYTNFEHIIIDGGSTDGSVEVIKEYEALYQSKQRHLYWVSEPDKGIYNGMNKGIKVAKGEYCLFLNSGDNLHTKRTFEKTFEIRFNQDIVYCNLNTPNKLITYPHELTLNFFFNDSLAHPATFIKKDLFNSIGVYNENYKIVSDWEFFIKAIINAQCSYKHLDICLSNFEFGGISNSNSAKHIREGERKNILKTEFPLMYKDYITAYNNYLKLMFYEKSKTIQFAKKVITAKLYIKFANFIYRLRN